MDALKKLIEQRKEKQREAFGDKRWLKRAELDDALAPPQPESPPPEKVHCCGRSRAGAASRFSPSLRSRPAGKCCVLAWRGARCTRSRPACPQKQRTELPPPRKLRVRPAPAPKAAAPSTAVAQPATKPETPAAAQPEAAEAAAQPEQAQPEAGPSAAGPLPAQADISEETEVRVLLCHKQAPSTATGCSDFSGHA